VNVSPTATTTYTLTAGNTSGGFTATSTAQATVTFSSAAVPAINSFTVDRPSVGPNGTVKLTANFDLGAGGGTATISNGSTVIAQSTSSPMTATLPVSSTTTFTLTAKNVDNNTATANVRVLAGKLAVFAGDPNINGFSDSPPRFDRPAGIAIDSSGNIYVADTGNQTIRLITNPGGVLTVSTLAGTPQMAGNMDGDGGTALFNGPTGLAVDASGNIFVADTGNNTIREITVSGGVATVSTLMDSNTGLPAQFNGPQDVAVDNAGNVYVADTLNDTIDILPPGGALSVFAGVTGVSGHGDSPNVHFNFPYGIAMDPTFASLYVADSGNNTIRKITIPGGVVSTLAGNATQPHGKADGTGAAALFFTPNALAVDPVGNIYVVDANNFTIRRVTPAGEVVTIIGVAGNPGALPGPLPAGLGTVRGIAVDPSANGNLYFNMLNAVYTAPY
jgi:sugar lactone lactonase YvrE